MSTHKSELQIQLNEYKCTVGYNIKFQVTEIVFPRDRITSFDGLRIGNTRSFKYGV